MDEVLDSIVKCSRPVSQMCGLEGPSERLKGSLRLIRRDHLRQKPPMSSVSKEDHSPDEVEAGTVIGHRYHVLGSLGRGGMGAALKVMDRLTGDAVTLKRAISPRSGSGAVKRACSEARLKGSSVGASTRQASGERSSLTLHGEAKVGVSSGGASPVCGERPDRTSGPMCDVTSSAPRGASRRGLSRVSSTRRVTIAHEFEVLAGLRHPHIIRVLDYGFDVQGGAFFTMELVRDAQHFEVACQAEPVAVKVRYLIQAFEALAYLHRRGIIHRDLKHSNVLVSGGQVKVLDFGLSLFKQEARELGGAIAGTSGFIAPELLVMRAPSPASDIYALGVMACEVLFGVKSGAELDSDVVTDAVEADGEALTLRRLRGVVRRLIKAVPGERTRDARQAIDELAEAIGQAPPDEDRDIRECVLQSASFVGRQAQLARLTDLFDDAQAGQGGACLVIGESGVGKSRLLRELRTQVLVRGGGVVFGQAVADNGGPYDAWRDVAARLTLGAAHVTPREAGVVRDLAPEVARILRCAEGDIVTPQQQGAAVSQVRLAATLAALAQRQRRPTLILLEDLQWAGPESLRVLAHVTRQLSGSHTLLVASMRADAGCDDVELPLHDFESLRLERLDEDSVAALSESLLGESGREQAVLRMLYEQSDGNPFFLMELLRAYADLAGGLAHITSDKLALRILPEGISSLVRQRLDRLLSSHRPLLHLAALCGRTLDEVVLAALEPSNDWGECIAAWLDAAVLDVHDGASRFAHDKLREVLLAEVDQLSVSARRRLHRRIAEAIEAVYVERADHVQALAIHWREAGDAARELHYAELAGAQAVKLGAVEDAVTFLERALGLMASDEAASGPSGGRGVTRSSGAVESARARRGRFEGLLAEARSQLGDVRVSLRHARRALKLLGYPMPEGDLALTLDVMGQLAQRGVQIAFPGLTMERDAARRERLSMAAAVQTRATEGFFFTQESLPLMWSALRGLNLGHPAGPSANLARGYILAGLALGVLPWHSLADACCERALAIARGLGEPYMVGFVCIRAAVCHLYVADWGRIDALLQEARECAQAARNPRLLAEVTLTSAVTHHILGRYQEGMTLNRSLVEDGFAVDRQALLWSFGSLGYAHLRQRQPHEALERLKQAQRLMTEAMIKPDIIHFSGLESLIMARFGAFEEASAAVERVLEAAEDQPPVVYWTCIGMAAVATACLEGLRRADVSPRQREVLQGQLERACGVMTEFGRKYPLGQPFAWLFEGERLLHLGHRRDAVAMLTRAVTAARGLSLRYELGRAYLSLSRAVGVGSPESARHLQQAIDVLLPLGVLSEGAQDATTPYDIDVA